MPREPKEGDLFYTHMDDGYHVCKIIKITAHELENRPPFITHHILSYHPLPNPPTARDVASLRVRIWHAPLAPYPPGENRTYFAHVAVTDSELQGYRAYLQENGEGLSEELVEQARAAYQRGCAMCDTGQLTEAIDAFGEAIRIIPGFVEALDNRGLIFLDLNRVEDAKKDFLESIKASDSDDNPLPHFKLIHCYLMSKDRDSALTKMKECIQRWPNHPDLDLS
jgi:tetratricopeptide (TPR) repeat protein